jgi:hypothetical protein
MQRIAGDLSMGHYAPPSTCCPGTARRGVGKSLEMG